MNLQGKQVLVVGLGRSGIAAALLCRRKGATVRGNDHRSGEQLSEAARQLDGIELLAGGHPSEAFTSADLIVLSPGVPPLPALQAAREAGVPIIGEVELSTRFCQAPVLAITGTNGKSTTTSLAGAMLKQSGFATFCGGNLGQPLAEVAETPQTEANGRIVLELSSFQLETVQRFRATVALLINLSEDHLDRYPDYRSYQEAKARIFEGQQAGDWAVVNGEADQHRCRELAARSAAQQVLFGACEDSSASFDGQQMVLRLPGAAEERYPRSALKLAGQHNVQNTLAALLGARLAGATAQGCREAIERFRGLPHRMELVAERQGVQYYNDSKATNVGAVVGSLTGFERPVILIAGGKDKGGDYAPLRRIVEQSCKAVVLIGAATEVMAQALGQAAPLLRAESLDHAVNEAAKLAQAGDAVVLSPACSSYDMFNNFEERGTTFAEAAQALPS